MPGPTPQFALRSPISVGALLRDGAARLRAAGIDGAALEFAAAPRPCAWRNPGGTPARSGSARGGRDVRCAAVPAGGARAAGADPRAAGVLEPRSCGLARDADPAAGERDADRGGAGRRGGARPRAPRARSRDRHGCAAAGSTHRVSLRVRSGRRLQRGRLPARPRQCGGARSGRTGGVRCCGLGGAGRLPIRSRAVQPAIYPARRDRVADAGSRAFRAGIRRSTAAWTGSTPIAA